MLSRNPVTAIQKTPYLHQSDSSFCLQSKIWDKYFTVRVTFQVYAQILPITPAIKEALSTCVWCYVHILLQDGLF